MKASPSTRLTAGISIPDPDFFWAPCRAPSSREKALGAPCKAPKKSGSGIEIPAVRGRSALAAHPFSDARHRRSRSFGDHGPSGGAGARLANFLSAFGRLARRPKYMCAIRKPIETVYLGALQGAQKRSRNLLLISVAYRMRCQPMWGQ